MSKDKYQDIYAGIFILIVGVVLLIASFSVPKGAAITIGSDFMPKVTCALMTLLGILIIVRGIKTAKNYKEKESKLSGHYKELGLSIVFMIVYMFLLKPVGFIIMTTAYITLQALVLAPDGRKKTKLFFFTGLITSVVIYIIFRNVFTLMLPAGILKIMG